MIFPSLVYFAYHAWTTSAAPVLLPGLDIRSEQSDLGGTQFDKNYRSTADIVWACWLTIFACTWVTVHPNIRGYKSTWKERISQRIELMFWATMTPEAMVMWAFRQWRGAKELHRNIEQKREELRGQDPSRKLGEWTITHTHFFQMGGYVFDRGGVIKWIDPCPPMRPLGQYEQEAKDGQEALEAIIQHPITEDEINDRSKGDALAKTFVVLQTLWFIIQCVARGAQSLAITQLEIITLAYAALNGITYFFWWYKPINVQCPIIITLPSTPANSSTAKNATPTHITSSTGIAAREDKSVLASEPKSVENVNSQNDHDPWEEMRNQPLSTRLEVDIYLRTIRPVRFLYKPVKKWIFPIRIVILLFLLALSLPTIFVSRLWDITCAQTTMPSTMLRFGERLKFPTFYSYRQKSGIETDVGEKEMFVGCHLATIFGAVHCAAWSFPFQSTTHQLLWRVSAIFICGAPLLFPLASYFTNLRTYIYHDSWFFRKVFGFLGTSLLLLSIISLVVYIPARFILFILSFIDLGHLSISAHQTVEWTNFLPHV